MILLSVNIEVASPTLGLIIGTVVALEQNTYDVLLKLHFKKQSGSTDFKYEFIRSDKDQLLSRIKPTVEVMLDFYLAGMMMEERPSVWLAEAEEYSSSAMVPSDGFVFIKKDKVA